ncbi:TAP-like protein-domain-containing protein [Exophiala viscosa]|uniref:TAP-like protein-domain-containing protein n=1 Tax=Exophiala viscosa TaxID=2486360 RepID=UPI00219C7CB9|nr:TAP-like protein-domain-containing protein [Exophiala viscosa]
MTVHTISLAWILLLAALGTTPAAAVDLPPPLGYHTADFHWDTIEASPELRYTKCYGSFECARLEVPLDWSNLSILNHVTLAIVRLPAVVDIADESFGGTIVINPGGPGGSGTDIVLTSGRGVQRIVDGDKHFEILSFDPRGMKFSTPNSACFTEDSARAALVTWMVNVGGIEISQHALDVRWSIDRGLGQLCEQSSNSNLPNGSNFHQYVSTALVAHDMLEIIDQVDAHLQRELFQRKKSSQDHQKPISATPEKNTPLLNYWGLSYGTLLGNTFASMFPERIGRMVLDGVVDADDYSETGWTTNLQDNNKTWATFFEYCFEAGPRCPLFDEAVKDPREIQAKVESFLSKLKDDPLPLLVNGNVYLLTDYVLRANIHLCLYFPNMLWPLLAISLRSLLDGEISQAVSTLETAASWHQTSHERFAPSTPFRYLPALTGQLHESALADTPGYAWQPEAAVSVLCGDGDDITSYTKAKFAELASLLESQSPLVGSIWAEIPLYCIHWPKAVRPSAANRFTGPFRSNLSDYDPRGSPLLFIANTADPVTPVRNALKMSEQHEGSVVLTQDVPGHCSGEVNPSFCTFEILKRFFGNGTIPKPGLVCEGARKPWDD